MSKIPRISRLMALAIRFLGLIRDWVVRDRKELAIRAHVTQPRMAEIMNLLNLAPQIKEELLFLPRVKSGKAVIQEKILADCGENGLREAEENLGRTGVISAASG